MKVNNFERKSATGVNEPCRITFPMITPNTTLTGLLQLCPKSLQVVELRHFL